MTPLNTDPLLQKTGGKKHLVPLNSEGSHMLPEHLGLLGGTPEIYLIGGLPGARREWWTTRGTKLAEDYQGHEESGILPGGSLSQPSPRDALSLGPESTRVGRWVIYIYTHYYFILFIHLFFYHHLVLFVFLVFFSPFLSCAQGVSALVPLVVHRSIGECRWGPRPRPTKAWIKG